MSARHDPAPFNADVVAQRLLHAAPKRAASLSASGDSKAPWWVPARFGACSARGACLLPPLPCPAAGLIPQAKPLRAHTSSPALPKPCNARVEPVSWRPRAFVFHNFMTEAEADHIVALAKPFVSSCCVGCR